MVRNGVAIPNASNSSYSIASAEPSDAGVYSVVISNQYQSVSSGEASLGLFVPTIISVDFTQPSGVPETGIAAAGEVSRDYWNICPPPASTNLAFVNGTQSGVGLTFSPANAGNYSVSGNGSSDPMYGREIYTVTNFNVTITNLAAGLYDFYLYGHGYFDYQNCIFQLSAGSVSDGFLATTNGPGWTSPIWQEGVQYVEFTNVPVLEGVPVSINVSPGAGGVTILSGLQIVPSNPGYLSNGAPFIAVQPSSQNAYFGDSVTFDVLAGGAQPLSYQW